MKCKNCGWICVIDPLIWNLICNNCGKKLTKDNVVNYNSTP